MKTKAYFPIIFSLYFPLFGKIIPGIKDLPWNFNKYSFIVMFFSVLIVLKKKIKYKINNELKYFIYFNIFMLSIIIFKGFFANDIVFASNIGMGFLLSLLIIIYVLKSGIIYNKYFFIKLTNILGVFLLLQILVSIYESFTGHLLGIYAISDRNATSLGVDLSTRSVLELFHINVNKVFGLKEPFSGLLGQHNIFGIMLVFYNAYFLANLEVFKNPKIKHYILLVFIGLIGNGTRSALLVVGLINLIYFYMNVNKTKRYLVAILSVTGGTLLLLLYITPIFNNIENFYFANDTITARIDIWDILLPLIKSLKISQLLFGVGLDTFERIFSFHSMESDYFSTLILYGISGLIFLFFILNKIYKMKIFNSFTNTLITNKLLVLSILLLSTVMTGLFFYVSYIVFTLTLLLFYQQKIFQKV